MHEKGEERPVSPVHESLPWLVRRQVGFQWLRCLNGPCTPCQPRGKGKKRPRHLIQEIGSILRNHPISIASHQSRFFLEALTDAIFEARMTMAHPERQVRNEARTRSVLIPRHRVAAYKIEELGTIFFRSWLCLLSWEQASIMLCFSCHGQWTRKTVLLR